MRAEFRDAKTLRLLGLPPAGQFALEPEENKQCNWDMCREQFAQKWTQHVEGFYFSHGPGQGDGVAGFICKTEEVLNLQALKYPWPKSSYSRTDRDTILWVEPSVFWRACELRRSLFTILLRCGMCYNPDKDDYEVALYGDGVPCRDQEYLRQTRLAVQRFLFGFTQYVKMPGLSQPAFYYKGGWRETFNGRDAPCIRQMLVLPDGEEKLATLIGVDTLWA